MRSVDETVIGDVKYAYAQKEELQHMNKSNFISDYCPPPRKNKNLVGNLRRMKPNRLSATNSISDVFWSVGVVAS